MKKKTAAAIYNTLSKGIDLVCPSGVTVKVKSFNLHDYLKHGIIPDEMLGTVLNVAANGSSVLLKKETAASFIDFLSLVISESLVAPHAILDRTAPHDAETVCVWDIPTADRLAIYNFAMTGYRDEVQKWLPLSKVRTTGGSTSSPGAMAAAHPPLSE